MILYFSGTGNSEYVAKYLADHLGDTAADMGKCLKEKHIIDTDSEKPYVVVSPVYVSVIPSAIEDLLIRSSLKGNAEIYFVMTCAGSGISASSVSAERICNALKKRFMGLTHLSMPQNYLMYFTTADKEENDKKFDAAVKKLPEICETVKDRKPFASHKTGLVHKMLASKPMIKLFDKMLIGTKKFYATDKCVSCGLCEKLCPENVITLTDGKPVWAEKGCLHCTSCINRCPTRAIEYGDKTSSKHRYVARKYVHGNKS